MTFEEWFETQFFIQFGSGKNIILSQSELCYQVKPVYLVEFARKIWEAGYDAGFTDGSYEDHA